MTVTGTKQHKIWCGRKMWHVTEQWPPRARNEIRCRIQHASYTGLVPARITQKANIFHILEVVQLISSCILRTTFWQSQYTLVVKYVSKDGSKTQSFKNKISSYVVQSILYLDLWRSTILFLISWPISCSFHLCLRCSLRCIHTCASS